MLRQRVRQAPDMIYVTVSKISTSCDKVKYTTDQHEPQIYMYMCENSDSIHFTHFCLKVKMDVMMT